MSVHRLSSQLVLLRLQRLEIALHGVLGELRTTDRWILLQWPLNCAIGTRLVEERYAVAWTVVIRLRVTRCFHAVKG